MAYSIDDVRRSLPNIGDQRHGGIVDYVNHDKLWYRVMMPSGTVEGYKLPRTNMNTPLRIEVIPKLEHKIKGVGTKVKCHVVETNKTYDSFTDCAKDLGCTPSMIHYAIANNSKLLRKYHVRRVD